MRLHRHRTASRSIKVHLSQGSDVPAWSQRWWKMLVKYRTMLSRIEELSRGVGNKPIPHSFCSDREPYKRTIARVSVSSSSGPAVISRVESRLFDG